MQQMNMMKMMLALFLGLVSGVVLAGVVLVVIMAGMLGRYVHVFATAAQVPISSVVSTAQTGWSAPSPLRDGRMTVLLLGTDALANRQGEKILTDTMMLLSLESTQASLSALSLPRDIWDEKNATKVNGLYHLGTTRMPDAPERFVAEEVSRLTQVPIHYTVVVSLQQVAEVIDVLGGVEIDVPVGFTDTQFPRDDVDIKTERDPAKLYETVEFVAGKQVLSGRRALQYIRSRKSTDAHQGNDNARAVRQQQVIEAVIATLRQPKLAKRPAVLGALYGMYVREFDRFVPMTDAIAVLRVLGTRAQTLTLIPQSVSLAETENGGVLIHPPVDTRRGWIYTIRDLSAFQSEVRQKLGLP